MTAGATGENWLDAPYNRWGFLHVAELARTEKISRGDGEVTPLPSHDLSLDAFDFSHEGETVSFWQMLEAT